MSLGDLPASNLQVMDSRASVVSPVEQVAFILLLDSWLVQLIQAHDQSELADLLTILTCLDIDQLQASFSPLTPQVASKELKDASLDVRLDIWEIGPGDIVMNKLIRDRIAVRGMASRGDLFAVEQIQAGLEEFGTGFLERIGQIHIRGGI